MDHYIIVLVGDWSKEVLESIITSDDREVKKAVDHWKEVLHSDGIFAYVLLEEKRKDITLDM